MPDFWSINVADFYFPHIFITVQYLRCSNTKSLQRGLVLNAVSTLQNNHQHFQSNLLQMLERSQWLKMGRQFICLKLINLKSLSHLSPSSLVPLAPGLWKEEVFFEFDMRYNSIFWKSERNHLYFIIHPVIIQKDQEILLFRNQHITCLPNVQEFWFDEMRIWSLKMEILGLVCRWVGCGI